VFEHLIREWSYLPIAFSKIFLSPISMTFLIIGAILGYVVGVLPGIAAMLGMAMVLGLTLKLPMDITYPLILGIWVSAIATGGITASLINIPGTPAALATAVDGFPMAKKGKAREASGAVILGSTLGCLISNIFALVGLPLFATFALLFGDWEIFLFGMMGILVVGALAGEDPIKGWIAGLLGFFISSIGMDELFAFPRFTFGNPYLTKGVGLLPALIGLFGLSEVFIVLKERKPYEIPGKKMGFAKIELSWIRKYLGTIFRSSGIGIWIGFIPGVGESVAPWVAYYAAKRSSKFKELFGKGHVEGVIAAEVANNAVSGGALLPTLALGIPGSGTTAILLAYLFLAGIRPGPLLIIEKPGFLVYTALLLIAAGIVTFIVAFLLSPFVIRILTLPREVILPIAVSLCIVGIWGAGFTVHDLWVLFAFGLLGFVLRTRGFPIAPMAVGILIGKILDTHLRRSIIQYITNPLGLFLRPIGIAIIVLLTLMLISGFRMSKAVRR